MEGARWAYVAILLLLWCLPVLLHSCSSICRAKLWLRVYLWRRTNAHLFLFGTVVLYYCGGKVTLFHAIRSLHMSLKHCCSCYLLRYLFYFWYSILVSPLIETQCWSIAAVAIHDNKSDRSWRSLFHRLLPETRHSTPLKRFWFLG